jgi:hypothetical protein
VSPTAPARRLLLFPDELEKVPRTGALGSVQAGVLVLDQPLSRILGRELLDRAAAAYWRFLSRRHAGPGPRGIRRRSSVRRPDPEPAGAAAVPRAGVRVRRGQRGRDVADRARGCSYRARGGAGGSCGCRPRSTRSPRRCAFRSRCATSIRGCEGAAASPASERGSTGIRSSACTARSLAASCVRWP